MCQCDECQKIPHASDCAVHNEPAEPKGECDCSVQKMRRIYRKDGEEWTQVRMAELKIGDTFKLYGTSEGGEDDLVEAGGKTEFIVTEEPQLIKLKEDDEEGVWSVMINLFNEESPNGN